MIDRVERVSALAGVLAVLLWVGGVPRNHVKMPAWVDSWNHLILPG